MQIDAQRMGYFKEFKETKEINQTLILCLFGRLTHINHRNFLN